MFWPKLMCYVLTFLNLSSCLKIPVEDCWTEDYDVLVVYDCRSKQPSPYHFDTFTNLHNYFSNNKGMQFSLATWGNEGIRVIKRFDETLSDVTNNIRKLKGYECPKEITPENLFQTTRHGFNDGRPGAKRMVLVILYKEADNFKINTSYLKQLETLQNKEKDIRRLFLIIDVYTLNIKKDMFIYATRSLSLIMNRVIGSMCSTCRPDTLSLSFNISGQKHKKCYSIIRSQLNIPFGEATKLCGEMFKLIKIRSQHEIHYLRSALPKKLLNLNISKALFFTQIETYLNYFLKDPKATSYKKTPKYFKNSCIFWNFQRTEDVSKKNYDHLQILNKPYINQENGYSDQFVELDCENVESDDQLTGMNDTDLYETELQSTFSEKHEAIFDEILFQDTFYEMPQGLPDEIIKDTMLHIFKKLLDQIDKREVNNEPFEDINSQESKEINSFIDQNISYENPQEIIQETYNETFKDYEEYKWITYNIVDDIDYKKPQDNVQICEVDLSDDINEVSVYDLGYETVEIEQLTLIPKYHFLKVIKLLLKISKYFDDAMKIECSVNNHSDIFCNHVAMCYSEPNDTRDLCDGPIQYVYKHQRVSNYLNHITINTTGRLMDYINKKNQSQEFKGIMLKNMSYKFQDYTFSDEVEARNSNHDTSSDNSNITGITCFAYNNEGECYSLASQNDSAQIFCPPNFVKCPGSNCAYLGDASWTQCKSPNYVGIVDRRQHICTAQIISVLKRTCTDVNLSFLSNFDLNQIDCDFVCAEGFKCLSGIIHKNQGDKNVYSLKKIHQSIGILEILDRYRIEAKKAPLLQLLEHLSLRAPNCSITNVKQWFREWDISQLVILDLSFNNLTSQDLLYISAIKTLIYLNVSYNRHLRFPVNARFNKLLETIDLSYTSVDMIPQAAFEAAINLKYLYLRQTGVKGFYSIGLQAYFSLNTLDLRDTVLQEIKSDFFKGLSISSSLFVNDYKLCCPQVTGPNIPQDKCYSLPGPLLSSCKDLIGDSNKRIVLWFVGIVAFIGNLFVVVYRLVWDREVLKKAYGVFVTCLGVSDLIMGIYLLVVASADIHFRRLYVLNDTRWRYGNICKFAGFLATFSSESSAFFICLITIDRYLIMRYPFGEHRISNIDKIRAVIITWTLSFLLALIPTFPLELDIYTSNSMCLALPLNIVEHSGWLYSFCVLILLNFLTFLIIFIGQILVFIWFSRNKMPQNSMISNSRSNDISIAKNLAFVAISDFLCWFPIAIMGFMSLGGYMFSNEAYSWSAVFVIPVNSALNPIIYTMPAVSRSLGTTICLRKS